MHFYWAILSIENSARYLWESAFTSELAVHRSFLAFNLFCYCGQKWQWIKVNTDTKINKLNSIFYWQLGQLKILLDSGGNVTTNAYFVSNNKLFQPYLSFFLIVTASFSSCDQKRQWTKLLSDTEVHKRNCLFNLRFRSLKLIPDSWENVH